jgi:hypothetical protein
MVGCREALFQPRYSEAELVAMLLGYKPLPWEANPAMISQHVHSPAAGRLIRHLLQYVLCSYFDCLVLVCVCELVGLEGLLSLCLFLLAAVCELVDLEVLIASETCCTSFRCCCNLESCNTAGLVSYVCDRCSFHISSMFAHLPPALPDVSSTHHQMLFVSRQIGALHQSVGVMMIVL